MAGPQPCPNGTVATTAERGGALPGEEIAVLTFTNRSDLACTITGFPGVELLKGGHPLGKPAVRSSQPVRTLLVVPGHSVAAQLGDATQCNAGLSDQVGVYVPNQTVQVRLPLQLRGCALTINPVRR